MMDVQAAKRAHKSVRPVRDLPKVHVHAHLDGSYPVAAVQKLAHRRGAEFHVPEHYEDVWAFFDAYGTVPPLVQDLDDLRFLCRALVHAEAEAGVVFLEPAIEPQLYAPRLGSLRDVTDAIVSALQEAAVEANISVGANLTVNTDQDEEIADELAGIAAALAGRGVTAFGTAGFVEPAGLARYQRPAKTAADAGLQIVSHAGQTGGADSVREALDVIGATRLSHGFRSAEDPDLVARLVEQRIVCDICPVSNVQLGVAGDLASHPGRALLEAGVPITLNADDSLWFGRDVADQYSVARSEWECSDDDLAHIAANGALIRGIPSAQCTELIEGIAGWLTAE